MGEPVRELEIEVLASDPVFELRHNGHVYSRFPQLDASVFHLELLVADLVLAALTAPIAVATRQKRSPRSPGRSRA